MIFFSFAYLSDVENALERAQVCEQNYYWNAEENVDKWLGFSGFGAKGFLLMVLWGFVFFVFGQYFYFYEARFHR
jgi:hypothetical protein